MELASVIAEYQLDNNAYGWFRPPWRDGRNAIDLARAAVALFTYLPPNLSEILAILDDAKHDASPSRVATYELAGEMYRQLVQPKIDTHANRLLAAALRCAQIKLANSDGGGHVYNEILIPAFLSIEPALVEDVVLEARCLDSIGTTHHLRGDRNDRQRSAFTTAWKRGLYLAAYAIPRAF